MEGNAAAAGAPPIPADMMQYSAGLVIVCFLILILLWLPDTLNNR